MVSSELRELYQELILEHSKKPRNFRVLEHANHTAEGFNPLCGDKIKLYLEIESDTVKDIGFQGSGCAISKASASMMTASVKGKKIKEVESLFSEFHQMLSGAPNATVRAIRESPLLGKLSVFSGVSEFPVRVKCATLAWHTLKAGMESNGKTVSTEA
ncbi:MAG: SUF system NifU family Fe-S cluster assembly protein [Candidatus Omnitrophica bacterium]|nr:SUF system NifU family Fe-S cluster assembly protein [Candidatus Omnitrophota bacterium]